MKISLPFVVACIVFTAPQPIHPQDLHLLTEIHSSPLEIIHSKPYLSVEIDGKGPFRFLVDTGTGGDAVVSPRLASQLNLPLAGEGRLDDPSGLGGYRFPLRKLDTLRFAGLDFYAIKAIEHDIPAKCDGILGFRIFRDFLLTLDYIHNRLVLADGELTPDGERSVLPFRMPDGVPLVGMKIGNRDVEALIDSGGSGLGVPESLIKNMPLSAPPTLYAKGQSLFSYFDIRIARLATDIQLGDLTFPQPWVEVHHAFPLANFGSFPLQHFIVTFDQENKLVRFIASSKRIILGVMPLPVYLTDQPDSRAPMLIPVG